MIKLAKHQHVMSHGIPRQRNNIATNSAIEQSSMSGKSLANIYHWDLRAMYIDSIYRNIAGKTRTAQQCNKAVNTEELGLD